ncbi:MAG: urea amidohydrolase (urease), subunit gamma [Nitrosopumilales archaeon]|nr:MAG: urea amidohydrolase (urease), subunit gamma [Nitrosopumilales archaeon]
MIRINALVKGEPDLPPITPKFEYDSSSEKIFLNGVNVVKARLDNNLRINIYETLLVYCAYIVSELRSGKTVSTIQNNAHRILSPDKVMIGVPESIQKIVFDVIIDDRPKEIVTFEKPIPTSNYILVPKTEDD